MGERDYVIEHAAGDPEPESSGVVDLNVVGSSLCVVLPKLLIPPFDKAVVGVLDDGSFVVHPSDDPLDLAEHSPYLRRKNGSVLQLTFGFYGKYHRRITVPSELRKKFGLQPGQQLAWKIDPPYDMIFSKSDGVSEEFKKQFSEEVGEDVRRPVETTDGEPERLGVPTAADDPAGSSSGDDSGILPGAQPSPAPIGEGLYTNGAPIPPIPDREERLPDPKAPRFPLPGEKPRSLPPEVKYGLVNPRRYSGDVEMQ
jgi:bifunctional DNA-binding transcriptional regulator/antitoxin component of YhaV-PrlF toxin-antitoxin module